MRWGLKRTRDLGLADLTLHAGFIPPVGDPNRRAFLDTLATVGDLAGAAGVTVAFETGQEPSALLRRTLDDLRCPNLGVNFDPANMLLYDKDDPLKAVGSARPGHPQRPRQGREPADDAGDVRAPKCRSAPGKRTPQHSCRR